MSESQNQPQVALNNQAAHRFEVREADDIAVLEYRLRGADHLVLVHTGVPHRLEGKGIGALLARTALEYAREHNMRVVPLCSFVQAYLQRHPEYMDVVDGRKM
ncbi:MAG: GNAT family N-acetyltransferase [Bryobacteraceae bacterium]